MGEKKDIEESGVSLLSKVSLLIDDNKRLIGYGFYLLGFAGLVKIGVSLKAFEQFKQVSDIPEEFFCKKINLFGRVNSVHIEKLNSENVPVLKVSHVPIFSYKHYKSEISLRIPGVNIHPNYREKAEDYLRIVCLDKKMKIKLLYHTDHYLVGQAWLKKYGFWTICLSTQLMKKGFSDKSSETKELPDDFLSKIEKSQKKAKKERKGMWAELEPEKENFLWKIINYFKSLTSRK